VLVFEHPAVQPTVRQYDLVFLQKKSRQFHQSSLAKRWVRKRRRLDIPRFVLRHVILA
jgi:hypothetical protein